VSCGLHYKGHGAYVSRAAGRSHDACVLLFVHAMPIELTWAVAEIAHDVAQRFAEEWVAAWNSHSLDRVLAHYAEDFTMASPRIIAIAGESSGVLRGKAQVRAYWARALSLVPDLRFELKGAYAGVGCVVVHYENQRKQLCAEVFFFADDGHTVRAATATYAKL